MPQLSCFRIFTMKWLGLLLFIATVNYSYAIDDDENQRVRIVGGRYVSIREVPYQAQLLTEEDTICGAAIISEYWLVSAAHCFLASDATSFVITTSSSESLSGERHEIEKYITHPDYSFLNHHDHDISLIKLKNPIQFNATQSPIGLATKAPRSGDFMKVSGYGWENLRRKRASQRRLKLAVVRVVSQSSCAKKYEELFTAVTDNNFCAGVNRVGSCTADSGGPGVLHGRLAGVVSGGFECNTSYYPGIYTRVDLYRDWIANHTGI